MKFKDTRRKLSTYGASRFLQETRSGNETDYDLRRRGFIQTDVATVTIMALRSRRQSGLSVDQYELEIAIDGYVYRRADQGYPSETTLYRRAQQFAKEWEPTHTY